jgi:hypothetical protein
MASWGVGPGATSRRAGAAKGAGLFSGSSKPLSTETQGILNKMMKEAGLNHRQMAQV